MGHCHVVGEVLVGLLNLDAASVRHASDDWRPTASLIQLLGHATRDRADPLGPSPSYETPM